MADWTAASSAYSCPSRKFCRERNRWKSVGARSGEYGGCWITVHRNFFTVSWTRLQTWGRALSWSKRTFLISGLKRRTAQRTPSSWREYVFHRWFYLWEAVPSRWCLTCPTKLTARPFSGKGLLWALAMLEHRDESIAFSFWCWRAEPIFQLWSPGCREPFPVAIATGVGSKSLLLVGCGQLM